MRSPMAEVFYNALSRTHNATSAGVAPEPIGGGPFSSVIAAMAEEGFSMQDCRSKLVTAEMVTAADIVIAFPTPLMPPYIISSPKTRQWKIIDPHYAPNDGTDYVRLARNEIKIKVEALIKELS